MNQYNVRRIRSFVKRQGRMTKRQRWALNNLWQYYVIEPEEVLDFPLIFQQQAPICLEIGMGMGEALVHQAKYNCDWSFVGIDVYKPGIGAALAGIKENGLANVRVIAQDAVEVLESYVSADSLDCLQIFFPDPWPKKRHHKRRLIQPSFVDLLVNRLKNGGQLQIATDWHDYAEQILQVLESNVYLVNEAGAGSYASRLPNRPLTKFEKRGQTKGHAVYDFLYKVDKS